MPIIENFAALSEKEQRDFAEALVKTINSEGTFSSDYKFNIVKVEPDELSGGLDIMIETPTSIKVPREATWSCEDPEDIPSCNDVDYMNSYTFEDIEKVFKTVTTELNGYKITLDVTDYNYTDEDVEVIVDKVEEADSGIGEYEYWGQRGFDSHPYLEVEGTLIEPYDCALTLFVDPIDAALSEEVDEEFYNDGSELFDTECSNVVGVIEDMIEDLDSSDPEDEVTKKKLTDLLNNPEQLEELKDLAVNRVCDNEIINNYINDYSISELGDMDGIWNEFGDCLESAIYEFINK